MYCLKKGVADFTVVDGPFERRSYKAGEVYDEKDIPPQEKNKFEIIDEGRGTRDEVAPTPETRKKGGK